MRLVEDKSFLEVSREQNPNEKKIGENDNEPGTAKVGAISKAQKARRF